VPPKTQVPTGKVRSFMTRVFLSYRHESPQNTTRVRELATRLEAAGIGVVLDQFAQERQFNGGGPDEGWPRWCKDQASSTEHKVLIVGTPGWFRVYQQLEMPGVGLGAAAEAGVIEQRLYLGAGKMTGIRVVAFADLEREQIPLDLQRNQIFNADTGFDQLVQWLTGAAPEMQAITEWPQSPPPLSWVMANHDGVRKAFAELITRSPSFRYLPVCGPSETGKSHIARQLLGNALRCEGLDCAHFDCKGTADPDSEFERMRQSLGVTLSAGSSPLNHRFGALLAALSARQRPCLLIFDTFEAGGALTQWVEDTLLISLIRQRWLRVVILGQQVPQRGGKAWDAESHETIVLTPPAPQDWYEFGLAHRPNVTREDVQTLYDFADGSSSLLFDLLGPKVSR
jgi:hypothetical protein